MRGQPLPTVDLAAPNAAGALAAALASPGMLALTGHRVPAEVIDRAHEAARDLFALPAEVKAAHASAGMGYRKLGAEALGGYRSPDDPADHKETFTARFDATAAVPWPTSCSTWPSAPSPWNRERCNDRWTAPLHRVAGAGRARYTLAWFLAPNREATIAPLPGCVPAGQPPRHPPVRVGDLLAARAKAQLRAP